MNRYLYIFLLSVLAVSEAEAQAMAAQQGASKEMSDPPRLVVNITIDQLRSDYLEAFMPLYGTTGFRKLLSSGLVFCNASYPFAPVDRASAIASVITGSVPCYNGIPSCEWLSRKTLRPVACTDDQKALLMPRGNAPTPLNLIVSTVGDEMKITTQKTAKVYSVAKDCDAAVLSAGHSGDCALWIDAQTGQWTTSAFFNKMVPEWVSGYNKSASPAKKSRQQTWKAKNDAVQKFGYFFTQKQQKPFSYSFSGTTAYADYLTSAMVNVDITDMALQCVSAGQLGMDNVTDLLNVQYYAGTFRHKDINEVGTELQDTYARLDDAIGWLVTSIEQKVGKDKVLFVVTSTGYFDEEPIDYTLHGVPSGTVFINRTASLLNMYLSAFYGQAHYVEGYQGNQIYLNHKLIEQKKLKMLDVLDRSREMLLMSDGITAAYTRFNLTTASDPSVRLLRNGYNSSVCGDIIVDVAPGWQLLNEDTHSNSRWSAQGMTFPIIVYGQHVAHDVVTTPVTTDQIAPTLSKSIRIRAPNACKNTPLR